MNHPDELTLNRMLDGELSPDRERTARSHLLACARCRATYEALQAETELLRAALREQEEELPKHLRARGDLSWLLLAAMVLAIVGIATFWTRFVEPTLERMDTVGLDGTSLVTTILIRSVLWRGWSDMASTLIDGLVLLVAVIAAGSVLHWAWRRLRSTPAALVLGLLIASQAIAPGAASAAVTAFERQRYILPAGEIVDNDLIVGAERIRIEGVVTGDLIVAARFVDVSGEVKGDVLGFAEQIEVTGEVGGSVRTASRVLDIEGRVERNITSAGETIRLQPGGALSGSFTAAARHVILDAPVDRDILVAAEIQEIGARVGGSAVMAGRRLAIGPNAAIAGEATFYGAEEPEVSPGAELASPLEFERIEEEEPSALGRVGNFVYFWAAAFLLGAAVMLLAPEATEEILTVHLPRYGRSLITGLLSLLVVLALSILLFVTLVGVPLALTALFVWSFGVYAAQAYVGAYIGREVLGPPTNPSQAMGRLALGLLLIHLAKQIPFVGEIVTVVVAIWGFGGFTLWALRHVPKTTVVPPAPAEAS